MIVSAIALCFTTHELGHYISARAFGHKLKFRFEWGWLFGAIPIPRYIWDMPDTELWKQRFIAISGFALECVIVCMLLRYCASAEITIYSICVYIMHILLYTFYAGKSNDFNYF